MIRYIFTLFVWTGRTIVFSQRNVREKTCELFNMSKQPLNFKHSKILRYYGSYFLEFVRKLEIIMIDNLPFMYSL